jgi:hypothetical protein
VRQRHLGENSGLFAVESGIEQRMRAFVPTGFDIGDQHRIARFRGRGILPGIILGVKQRMRLMRQHAADFGVMHQRVHAAHHVSVPARIELCTEQGMWVSAPHG